MKTNIGDLAMRRNYKSLTTSILLLLVLVLVCGSVLYAGNSNRKGTAGAMELLIPVGARSAALSGSTISSVGGAEAIHWNPAGISRIDGVEAMFSNLQYIADIKVNYVAVATNFGSAGTFGVSVKTLNFGNIPITTVDLPEGTGGTYSPSFITFGLSYSRQFTDRIFGGVNFKYISEKIVRTSATGFAIDLGVQYVSTFGLQLGVTLKNLGPEMKFSGEDLQAFVQLPYQEPASRQRSMELPTAPFELPSILDIGIGYEIQAHDDGVIGLYGNFQNTNFGSDEFRIGAEYGWNKMLFVRGGYMLTSDQEENIYGPTFGVGINIPFGSSAISVSYAYRQAKYINNNQWIDVKLSF